MRPPINAAPKASAWLFLGPRYRENFDYGVALAELFASRTAPYTVVKSVTLLLLNVFAPEPKRANGLFANRAIQRPIAFTWFWRMR